MRDCISFESLFEKQVWPPGTSVEFSAGIYSLSNDSIPESMIVVRDTSNISFLGDIHSPSVTVIECVM